MSPTATAPAVPDYQIPDAMAALEERYERLPIACVLVSKTNPRTHFDDAYLAELANSILDKGVIQPILVRPIGAAPITSGIGLFEIIAGECRWRASKIAQRSHIPAVIRQYTDEQVLELQLIENIHRQDLSPLEQAAGYRALITSNPDKHSAESIAQRIGMSPAWVWDRMKLNDLVPGAKQILEQERMTVGHAILIARLKPSDQQRVIAIGNGRNGMGLHKEGLWEFHSGLDWDDDAPGSKKPGKYDRVKAVSVRELEAWIHDHIRFDVTHMAKAVPLQFAPTAEKVEEAAAQPGRSKKVVPITFSYRVADDARDSDERTYGSESWKRADGQFKSKTCEHSVLGLVVAGRGQGDSFDVCVARDKCRVHFGEVIRAKEKAAKLRESGKGKQAAKVEKRATSSWEEDNRKRQEANKRWDALKGHAVAAVVAKLKPAKFSDKVLQGVIDEMLEDSYGDLKEFEKLLGTGKITTKNFTLALTIIDVMARDNTREYFQPLAKKYGVDLAKLEKSLQTTGAAEKPKAKAS